MCKRLLALRLRTLLTGVLVLVACVGQLNAADNYTNTLGMKMIRIEEGTFLMGRVASRDDWEQQPVHKVTISKPFYMSETEVTVEQFQQFRPDYQPNAKYSPYAASISWYDAEAFCKWLSDKEGRPYRLPTEAEWEYACRAGTTTKFASGQKKPPMGWANQWGLKNMHTGVREWCLDWEGPYLAVPQTDPVGPAYGMARIVRGGGLDNDDDRYACSAGRASIAPAFAPYPELKSKVKKTTVSTEAIKPGLVGTKFGESDLSNPKKRIDWIKVNADWDENSCSAQLYGYIAAPYSGEVTFIAEAQDGLRLKISGKNIIDGWGQNTARTGTMVMVKDKKYPVVLSYFQDHGGPAYLRLYWSWPGHSKELIPADALWHSEMDETRVKDDNNDSNKKVPFGTSPIGFRVVQAPMPTTRPTAYEPPFARQCVIQNTKQAKQHPDATKPYFRKRYLLPTPPENVSKEAIDAAGLNPAFRRHNHSPALEVCPNGDVLMVIYTSYDEYESGVSLMATRLRFGSDQWDMPCRMFDFASANDHAPLLWTDNGTVNFFWGSPKFDGRAFPFQWTSSKDNGATWSEVKFPHFIGPVGCHSRQPINTALRDLQGTMYVASDGCGGRSVLWASGDNGKTWYDTGGRSAGRHTTFVLLKDGSILGMGGKNTDIDGYMPKAISHDGGKTWEVSKTPFASLGSNQRPIILRLQSGRLFFASDFQNPGGKSPATIKQRGCLAALSDDDGKTWHIKKLVGTQQHESKRRLGGADTLGYSVARQAPNGLIHLITTMNRPCLHLVFNEAWILADHTKYEDMSDAELMRPAARKISKVKKHQQKYPNGKLQAIWSGGIADNGRFLLDGTETWYYKNGRKQWEVTYKLGRKVGKETHWAPNGTKEWQWVHKNNGDDVWTQWWPNGQKKAHSTWRNFKCEGIATCWDRDGKLLSQRKFVDGKLAD